MSLFDGKFSQQDDDNELFDSLQETIRTQQSTIDRLTEQLKAMVETYQYEASSENPTLLATKALIAEIEAGNE